MTSKLRGVITIELWQLSSGEYVAEISGAPSSLNWDPPLAFGDTQLEAVTKALKSLTAQVDES